MAFSARMSMREMDSAVASSGAIRSGLSLVRASEAAAWTIINSAVTAVAGTDDSDLVQPATVASVRHPQTVAFQRIAFMIGAFREREKMSVKLLVFDTS